MFQYKIAVKKLDTFVFDAEDPTFAFQRAYARLKMAVIAVAIIDYGEYPREEALAYAWEEADVAFRGYADESMTGPIVQLWRTMPDGEEENFHKVVKEAFAAAVAATDKKHKWLHLKKYRTADIRDLESGFGLPTAMPVHGPRVRDWAVGLGRSEELVAAALTQMQEEMDAFNAPAKAAPDDTEPPRRPHLTLVKG